MSVSAERDPYAQLPYLSSTHFACIDDALLDLLETGEGARMTDRAVRIMLPVDGRILTVDLDDTLTTSDIIAELLAAGQLQPNPHGYQMGKKGGDLLNRDAQIRDLGLTDQDVLRVIPATDAGIKLS